MRILHLSDTHVGGNDTSAGGGALSGLEALLAGLEHIADVNLLLVTGDLADDGSSAGSTAVRDRLSRFTEPRGIPQIVLPGNSDVREVFRDAFGSGHLGPGGFNLAESTFSGPECATVSSHDGLRVITLDSSIPGEMAGRLGGDQLEWLREALQMPARQGTVLALHHPPLTLADSPFLSKVALQNPAELADVLGGSDVRVVLCGHFHLQAMGFLGTVPVWVTPGVESRVDATAPADTLRFIEESGASVVTLAADGSLSFHVVRPPASWDRTRSIPLTAASFGP